MRDFRLCQSETASRLRHYCWPAVVVRAQAQVSRSSIAPLGTRSVLRRALDCFVASPFVDIVRVVIHPDDHELYEEATSGLNIAEPVHGGSERHLSALNGLESLISEAPDYVLIHDAARPFVSPELIERVISALDDAPSAIPALPISDTLKRVAPTDLTIVETVDRGGIWRAQTPQGFHFNAILDAHRERESEFPTDDAAVLEQAGMIVSVTEGDEGEHQSDVAGRLRACGANA